MKEWVGDGKLIIISMTVSGINVRWLKAWVRVPRWQWHVTVTDRCAVLASLSSPTGRCPLSANFAWTDRKSVPRDARKWRSCASGYWQLAILHRQVRKMHRNGIGGTPQERLYTAEGQTSVQSNRCLIKRKYGLKKGRQINNVVDYSLASATDGPCPRGWGPTLKFMGPHWKWSSLNSDFPL